MDTKIKKLVPQLLAILLVLTSCGKTTSWSPLQVASAMAESQSSVPALKKAVSGSEAYEYILLENYGLDTADVEDGAILVQGGVYAFEIAALKLSDKADEGMVKMSLEEYLDQRINAFTGYFPEQEAILRQSEVVVKNGWALLLICTDTGSAKERFEDCFREYPPKKIPEYRDISDGQSSTEDDDWTYDHDRLVDAWNRADPEGLSDKDIRILAACMEVFDHVIKTGQTLPELELAVHDWMVDHIEYDTATLEGYGGAPDPDNDNPYGALVNGKGICAGYTSSFQLLMDLSGIECISVSGTSNNGIEIGEHAWNQVRFDGEWYVVDVTWDDPLASFVVPAETHHRYFNKKSSDIRHNHFWNEAVVPEANGDVYTWNALRKKQQ